MPRSLRCLSLPSARVDVSRTPHQRSGPNCQTRLQSKGAKSIISQSFGGSKHAHAASSTYGGLQQVHMFQSLGLWLSSACINEPVRGLNCLRHFVLRLIMVLPNGAATVGWAQIDQQ